jgi:hypothetical protein
LPLVIASCSLWGGRQAWVETYSAYDISFFSTEPQLMNTETYSEKNNKTNEILTAYKGYTVVASKTYNKEYYASESARINKDGALNNGSAIVDLKKGDTRPVIGLTDIDGVQYFLVPTDIENFVFIVRDNGSFYKKMGQIRYGKLIILETDFVPYPDDIRFEPIMSAATSQTKVIDGFEIKYNGFSRGRLEFLYMEFNGEANESGSFKTLHYANRKGQLNIKGTKINIVNATNDKLDYTILE